MEALRDHRKKEKMNQAEMAAFMRVSFSAYKKVETGERLPSAGFIRKFKAAFPNSSTDIFFPTVMR